ncbi:MAG: PfkB family carbohydrate kinase [Elusimicrobia bacterium]|nr:PfkB family carbohydrate kinase [Candidatus Liberimonas magnetica]
METKIISKIKNIHQLAKIIEGLKKKGKKIVQCHGVFDLVHLGHMRHFNEAKKQGDILVVTLTKDKYVKRGPGRPYFNEHLRAETLASLAVTDYVAILNSPTAIEAIKTIKPDVYVKGPDYKEKDKDVTGKIYEEEEAVKSVGGKLYITEDITFSSTKLLNSFIDVYPPRTVKYLNALSKRYSAEIVAEKIESLKKLDILVLGDAIIDQYHYCSALGKSSKEHLVVNKYHSDESFAGGALATANNAANICGSVDLLTVLGERDSFEGFIRSKLNSNINPMFFTRKETQTIIKRRFVSNDVGRKLFEICYMDDTSIPDDMENKVINHLAKTIKKYDLVIVADFGHGLLTKRIINYLCAKSRYLAINVQTNSANIGFNLVTKYPSADCVCIDEMEMRYATHDRFNDLKGHMKTIYNRLKCSHIITTRGSSGSMSYSDKEGFHETPAFAYKVVDPIGAGDAFFAYVAPCFASGFPQDMVSFIGNAVGSIATQIVCNREPVNKVDLLKFITRLLK